MGLTDYSRYSEDPVGDAMDGIYNYRLKQRVAAGVLGSQYDSEANSVEIFDCIRYLELIGKKNWDCTCPARTKRYYGLMKHGNECLVTPEYAAVSKQLGTVPELISGAIKFTFWNLDWDTWDENKDKIRTLK